MCARESCVSKRRNSAEGGVTWNNPSDASQIERVSSVRERERTERAAQNSIQLEGALMSIFFFQIPAGSVLT